jgi:hypothetical protein
MAARGFSRAGGTEFRRPGSGSVAANGRPSIGNVRGNPSLRAAGRPRRLAATKPDRRQSLGHRGSASSGSSTGATRGRWRGYDRHNWGPGPAPWRLRMAQD